PRPGNLSWRPRCAGGRDQSVPLARDFLFCLSPLLDGRDLTGHHPGYLTFPSANSISRMAPDLERRSRLATRDVALWTRWNRATAGARLYLEKSIDFRSDQSFAQTSQRR